MNVQDTLVLDTHSMEICPLGTDGGSTTGGDVNKSVSMGVENSREVASSCKAAIVDVKIEWLKFLARWCLGFGFLGSGWIGRFLGKFTKGRWCNRGSSRCNRGRNR